MAVLSVRRADKGDLKTLIRFAREEASEAEGLQTAPEALRAGIEAALDDEGSALCWVLADQHWPASAPCPPCARNDWNAGYYWWVQSLFVEGEHRGTGAARLEAREGRSEMAEEEKPDARPVGTGEPPRARRLGRTDILVSPLGLGCWQFSQGRGFAGRLWANVAQSTVDAIVSAALDGGVTWFDTAQAYGGGRSERALSAALRQTGAKPGEVVVATKWMPLLKPAADLVRTIDQRLACLDGYPIDLYQVHFPASLSSVRRQMAEMAKLVRAGKIRAVGVCNFSAKRMREANDALRAEGLVLASNQVRVSLLDRRIESNGLLEEARRLGVSLIAYSPLAQGVLTGVFHADPGRVRSLPVGRRTRWSPFSRAFTRERLAASAPLIRELTAVGRAHDASAAQVALAWLLAFYGDTVVAIPGATKPEQAHECAAAMRLKLTAEEMAQLDRASWSVASR